MPARNSLPTLNLLAVLSSGLSSRENSSHDELEEAAGEVEGCLQKKRHTT